jgi:phosphate uptake regulator
MENYGSLEEFQQALDRGIAKIAKVVPELEQLNAPSSLSEQHTIESKMGKNLLSNLRQLSQAFKNLDLEKLESTSKNLENLSTQYDKDIERVNKAFVNESKLRKHIDAASEADTSIKQLLEA